MLRRALLAIAILAALTACEPAPPPGVFVSRAEVAALPTSGPAWEAVRAAALKPWGTPTIANQDSTVDTDTLAGALVAVRLDDDALRAKVRAQLAALVASHPYERVLALSRELPSYVIAADLVGLEGEADAAFDAFLREALTHDMTGHSGGTDLHSTALRSPNNWGTMARGAAAVAYAYLDDDEGLAAIAAAQEAWLTGHPANCATPPPTGTPTPLRPWASTAEALPATPTASMV